MMAALGHGNSALAAELPAVQEERSSLLDSDREFYGIVQNDPLDELGADRAASLGVGSIKVRIKASDALVPGDGMYDFIVQCVERGLEVVALFNHESVGTDYAEPDLDKTRDRAEEVVDKLQGLVSAWEVWNEPQSIEPTRDMSAETLMRVLGTAYPVMHATGAPVLAAPEWCAGNGDRFRHDMAVWWNANRGEYPEVKAEWPFDILAVHAYFLEGWDPRQLISESMARIAVDFGAEQRVWVTEFGTSGFDAQSEEAQKDFAENVAGEFAQHENVDRMFWYALQDYPGDESGARMGIYTQEGREKPVGSVWGAGKLPAVDERDFSEQPTEELTRPFAAPYASLDAEFRAHADRLGAEPSLTLWNEWFPAYLQNEFFAHAERLGAEPSRALWDEWYPAWQQNAG